MSFEAQLSDPVNLAFRIKEFLSLYAIVRPDFDPEYDDEEERFVSPDASILFAAQKILEVESALPESFFVDSSWDSGGYSPRNDAAGRAMHNQIVTECRALINAAVVK